MKEIQISRDEDNDVVIDLVITSTGMVITRRCFMPSICYPYNDTVSSVLHIFMPHHAVAHMNFIDISIVIPFPCSGFMLK